MAKKKREVICIWPYRVRNAGPWGASLFLDKSGDMLDSPHRCKTRSGIIRWAKRVVRAIQNGNIESRKNPTKTKCYLFDKRGFP